MYQVFNMGHRLEIFTEPQATDAIIKLIRSFEIDAKIVGHVEAASEKQLVLKLANEEILH